MTGRRPARAQRRIDRPGPFRPWRRLLQPALVALAAAALAVALHAPALTFGFVRDDHELVEQNPLLTSGGPAALVASDFWLATGSPSGMWRPVVTLSYAWDARTSGVTPRPFHRVNVLLHAAVTALVALGAFAAGGAWAAAAAGAWFATAPVHVESVAWIAGRTDLWCALFAVAALLLDRRARARAGRGATRALAVAAFALALLSKEVAASWIAVLAIAAWVETPAAEATPRRLLAWLTPYLAVTLVYVVAHAVIAAGVHPSIWQTEAQRFARRLGALQIVPLAIAYLLPGTPHAADRIAPPVTPAAMLVAVAIDVAAIGLLAWLVRRRSAAATPLGVFIVPLAVTAALAAATSVLTVAERNVYLPSVGVAWLIGAALAAFARRVAHPAARALAIAAVAALAGAGAVQTVRALPDWRDDASMYAAMVRVQPAHAEARIGLANELLRRGDTRAARVHLDAAAAAEPRHPALHVSRAWAAAIDGDWAGELAEARAALASNPARADAWVHEIAALVRLGRLAEADSLNAARWAAYPHTPRLESLRGRVALLRGRPDEALPLLESSTRWIADDPALWAALGDARAQTGRVAESRDAFERALALEPSSYDAWLQLAVACAAGGDRDAARAALTRAASLPGAADGRAARLAATLEQRWSAGP